MTSIKKFNVIWIDDNIARVQPWVGSLAGPLRGQDVEVLLESFEVTSNLIPDITKKIETWRANPPSLIIIDQKFTQAGRLPFDLHGSALAHLIRLELPHVPIVCVTAQTIDSSDFNMEDLSEYTYLFSIEKLSDLEQQERLFSIAEDFSKLCFESKQGVRRLIVQALAAPASDSAALNNILPEEFESQFIHGTTPHRIAKWVLTVLMQRPGFLWDALDAGTFLGLTEEAFARISDQFEPALYKGPFQLEAKPLWWASEIANTLYEAVPDHAHLRPVDAGRHLPGILPDDFSKCIVSGETPDVVVYSDSSRLSRFPVSLRYAVPLSDEESSVPGFPPRLKLSNERRG